MSTVEEKVYSVEQIAKLINMHPKTIRNFIRNGKLRAHKVGKEWRVSGHDLSVFVEGNSHSEPVGDETPIITPAARPVDAGGEAALPKVAVSAVVDVAIESAGEYQRLSSMLLAVLNTHDPDRGRSAVSMRYFEREQRLKVMIWGAPAFVNGMIDAVATLVQQE